MSTYNYSGNNSTQLLGARGDQDRVSIGCGRTKFYQIVVLSGRNVTLNQYYVLTSLRIGRDGEAKD